MSGAIATHDKPLEASAVDEMMGVCTLQWVLYVRKVAEPAPPVDAPAPITITSLKKLGGLLRGLGNANATDAG